MADSKTDGSNKHPKEMAPGEHEIIQRLTGFQDPAITDELYDFGKELVRDAL